MIVYTVGDDTSTVIRAAHLREVIATFTDISDGFAVAATRAAELLNELAAAALPAEPSDPPVQRRPAELPVTTETAGRPLHGEHSRPLSKDGYEDLHPP